MKRKGQTHILIAQHAPVFDTILQGSRAMHWAHSFAGTRRFDYV